MTLNSAFLASKDNKYFLCALFEFPGVLCGESHQSDINKVMQGGNLFTNRYERTYLDLDKIIKRKYLGGMQRGSTGDF